MSILYTTNKMLTMSRSNTCMLVILLGALLTVILHVDKQTNQVQAATSITQAAIVSSLKEAAKINNTKNDTNGDTFLKQKQWTLNADIDHSDNTNHVEKSASRIVLLSADENNDDISSNSISSSHRPQHEYACGRAIANTKYRDNSLLRDNRNYNQLNKFASSNGPRAKYRPTEIRMPRIIGGDETLPGEFPWTVSIKLNGQPICGGSLINRSWILTAAHCVVGYNPKNLTVRLGAYRIKDLSESQTIDLPLSLFIVHRDYSMPRPFSNDIALLKIVQPLEYTDYIIPICLPTEDQVVTSTSSMIVTDYTQKFNGITKDSDLPPSTNNDEDTGVVISTRMSDNEIAQCFDRLERNYLNSIGLTPIIDPANGSTDQQEPAAAPINAPKPSTSPSPSSAAAPASLSAIASPPNTLFPYGSASSLVDPIFMATDSAGSSSISATDKDLQNSIHRAPPVYVGQQHLQTHYNGKPLTLIPSQHNKLAEQHFEPITSSVSNSIGSTFGSHQSYPSRGPSSSSSYHISSDHIGHDNGADSSDRQDQYTYYGLHWNKRMVNNLNQQQEQQSRSRMELPVVKLRLPMSKELLHEIESVGSGSMPALDLDPSQQNELAAMAEDLSSAAAAERERVIQHGSGTVIGSPSSSSSSSRGQVVRTTLGSDPDEPVDLSDDPTKYSGLSGTVVGWGWVRELDGDIDQTNNKGYPSVTLQKVKLPILRNSICEAWFQSQAKKITLLPSQFCAGFNSGGKDACRGDSGGPMIIEDNSDTGRYKLIGIVSAGIGCARPSLPGLYTRVASFLPWINAQIRRY